MQDKSIEILNNDKEIEEKNNENISRLINQLNKNIAVEHQFSGPLPLEVLRNLTPEQSDKLLNNFINQETKEHETNMKVLNMLENNNKENNNIKKMLIKWCIPSFLMLVIVCLYTGNKDILIEILKLLFTFLGGTGVGIFYSEKNKTN